MWIVFMKKRPCASIITTTEIQFLVSFLFIGAYTFNCALWDLVLDLNDIIALIYVLDFPYNFFFLLIIILLSSSLVLGTWPREQS